MTLESLATVNQSAWKQSPSHPIIESAAELRQSGDVRVDEPVLIPTTVADLEQAPADNTSTTSRSKSRQSTTSSISPAASLRRSGSMPSPKRSKSPSMGATTSMSVRSIRHPIVKRDLQERAESSKSQDQLRSLSRSRGREVVSHILNQSQQSQSSLLSLHQSQDKQQLHENAISAFHTVEERARLRSVSNMDTNVSSIMPEIAVEPKDIIVLAIQMDSVLERAREKMRESWQSLTRDNEWDQDRLLEIKDKLEVKEWTLLNDRGDQQVAQAFDQFGEAKGDVSTILQYLLSRHNQTVADYNTLLSLHIELAEKELEVRESYKHDIQESVSASYALETQLQALSLENNHLHDKLNELVSRFGHRGLGNNVGSQDSDEDESPSAEDVISLPARTRSRSHSHSRSQVESDFTLDLELLLSMHPLIAMVDTDLTASITNDTNTHLLRQAERVQALLLSIEQEIDSGNVSSTQFLALNASALRSLVHILREDFQSMVTTVQSTEHALRVVTDEHQESLDTQLRTMQLKLDSFEATVSDSEEKLKSAHRTIMMMEKDRQEKRQALDAKVRADDEKEQAKNAELQSLREELQQLQQTHEQDILRLQLVTQSQTSERERVLMQDNEALQVKVHNYIHQEQVFESKLINNEKELQDARELLMTRTQEWERQRLQLQQHAHEQDIQRQHEHNLEQERSTLDREREQQQFRDIVSERCSVKEREISRLSQVLRQLEVEREQEREHVLQLQQQWTKHTEESKQDHGVKLQSKLKEIEGLQERIHEITERWTVSEQEREKLDRIARDQRLHLQQLQKQVYELEAQKQVENERSEKERLETVQREEERDWRDLTTCSIPVDKAAEQEQLLLLERLRVAESRVIYLSQTLDQMPSSLSVAVAERRVLECKLEKALQVYEINVERVQNHAVSPIQICCFQSHPRSRLFVS
jgi:hypothetical protein